MGLDSDSGFPRFNMPLELGLFLGAKRFGGPTHASKNCLILSGTRYDFQKYISDIAGQDIRAHGGSVEGVIDVVREWCSQFVDDMLPGPERIARRFEFFLAYVNDVTQELGLVQERLSYNDYTTLVAQWLSDNPT